MKVNPNSNWNFKLFLSSFNFEKSFFPKQEFWALVKKNFSNSSTLIYNEKEITVKNLANLIEGEKILLFPKLYSNKVELEILERAYSYSEHADLKTQIPKTSLGFEKFLETSLSESSNLNQIFSTLKVFFPWIDWNLETPYFYWDWEDGKGEGFLSKEKGKLLLKIFRPILGNLDFMIDYSLPSASQIELLVKTEKQEVYSAILSQFNSLKKYFIDNGIKLKKITLYFQTQEYKARGWKA